MEKGLEWLIDVVAYTGYLDEILIYGNDVLYQL